jgi:hypothetical protein
MDRCQCGGITFENGEFVAESQFGDPDARVQDYRAERIHQ